ncbi:MAG TPA: hypothetical protein VHX87_04500 [Galbitalea sp.]|nr:hypothetical protein [Galbitalea sp.]
MKLHTLGASIAVSALISLALVGCTASKSTVSAVAASCSPATAQYFWGKRTRTTDVPLGVHILTYSSGGSMQLDEPKTFSVEPSYTASALVALSRDSRTSVASWRGAILDRARKLPTMGAWYGATVPLGKNFVEISKPRDGRYVVEVGENQFEFPFAVTCGADDPVTGTITAAVTGGKAGYAIRCGAALSANDKKNAATLVALKYCATS